MNLRGHEGGEGGRGKIAVRVKTKWRLKMTSAERGELWHKLQLSLITVYYKEGRGEGDVCLSTAEGLLMYANPTSICFRARVR